MSESQTTETTELDPQVTEGTAQGEGGTTETTTTETRVTPATPPAWATARINEVTRKWHDEERKAQLHEARIAELEAQLRAKEAAPAPGAPPASAAAAPAAALTEAQIHERAVLLAEQARFNEACDNIARDGRSQFKDFQDSVNNFQTYLNGVPQAIVEGAMETENPARTFYELGRNMEEASRIARLSPARQAAAVVRFANGLESPAGEAKVPGVAPLPKPIAAKVGAAAGGGHKAGEARLDDDGISIHEWMKKRNSDLKR